MRVPRSPNTTGWILFMCTSLDRVIRGMLSDYFRSGGLCEIVNPEVLTRVTTYLSPDFPLRFMYPPPSLCPFVLLHFPLHFVNICIAVCGLPTCVWWLSGVWGSVPGGAWSPHVVFVVDSRIFHVCNFWCTVQVCLCGCAKLFGIRLLVFPLF